MSGERPAASARARERRRGAGEQALVPDIEPRSYYGRPVIKEPVWTWEIPCYFFAGGLAGASATFAWLAELRGSGLLARRAWAIALAGAAASPALLIADLGRPRRFLNMLRLFKVTSPMSVGSWMLATGAPAIVISTLNGLTGAVPRIARLAKPSAALLGLPLSTYTAALVANTAVPVWHEARHTLPFLFAGGAAASTGAALTVATPLAEAAPARGLTAIGAALEIGAARAMEQRLGELGEPYHRGPSGTLNRVADGLTVVGALVTSTLGGRRRAAAVAGGVTALAGLACKRWAVFKAGFASAADPRYTVAPQRERVRSGAARGAARAALDSSAPR